MQLTPETFDFSRYKASGWRCKFARMSYDPNECRIIVHFVAGRQWSILFTVVASTDLGLDDPAIKEIEERLKYYSFPLIERFITELEVVLSDIYDTPIVLKRP